jgi:Holliday junction resolvase RusA-like endonuclease
MAGDVRGAGVIVFVVPGEPVGKGRPRAFRVGNGVRMHTPDKTARYENLVALSAQESMAGRMPLDGPVAVDMLLITTPPASWSKRKRAQALDGMILPTTKPDCDNVLKAIADACNGIVWGDDKQITDVVIRKRYGVRPMARVAAQPAEVCE